MKWTAYVSMMTLLYATQGLALEPVTLSEPEPPLSSVYGNNAPTTVVYTVTNRVPKRLPIELTGISSPLSRTHVHNDCRSELPAESTCNIGIIINPTDDEIGSHVTRVWQLDYQGRAPLTSEISFSVVQSSFVYVTPSPGASSVLRFAVNPSDGFLVSEALAYDDNGMNFGQSVFATIGGSTFLYSVDENQGTVNQCTLDEDGNLSPCVAMPQILLGATSLPVGIAFLTVNALPYLYVTSAESGSTYQCSIAVGGLENGALTGCSPVTGSPSVDAPYGITFASVNGQEYVYIANAGPGTSAGNVYQCTVNLATGAFSGCAQTPSSEAPDWIPYAVAFATVNGTQYAYVADNGTDLDTGHVYRCTLNIDGSFNLCTPTPVPSPSYNWTPAYLAFQTVYGTQYAYVSNYQGPNGSSYRCKFDNDGFFTDCKITPKITPPGWQPIGMAFN